MTQSSNGITPAVIRGVMPRYQLSVDLLQATFAAIPAPPPDATTASRHARIARLTQEISALMPANAAQARIAAQIVIGREFADTATAQAPGVTMAEFCRLVRATACQPNQNPRSLPARPRRASAPTHRLRARLHPIRSCRSNLPVLIP